MKIMWVTNKLPGFLAKYMNITTNNNLGWLDYSAEKLAEIDNVELSLLFPSDSLKDGFCGFSYYTLPEKYKLRRNDEKLVPIIKDKIRIAKPDVIHIYGTEYFHTVACVKACEQLGLIEKTVISIQGLVSVCAKHYLNGLPENVCHRYTLHDLLKRENQIGMMKKFMYRGEGEVDALKMCKNVIGRTEWDKACTLQINPIRNYYHCNETLRECFYEGKWVAEKCAKHTIFVSQLSYSIKGFHILLEAMPKILERFPDAKIYVTGTSPFKMPFYRINSYYKYIKDLITKYKLKDHIVFLGSLNAEQMKAQYLRSNVFVLSSSIENSPNSLGEAMILGVPCVASDVGGVSDLMVNKIEGYLYPYDESYMLAHYVCKVFEDSNLAVELGRKARAHAQITHNPKTNVNRLMEIYQQLMLTDIEVYNNT